MTDVFLAHAPSDRPAAVALATELRSAGWRVWQGGASPDLPTEEWETELRAARMIVVVWSDESMGSDRLRRAARFGLVLGRVVVVTVGEALPPSSFGSLRTLRLEDALRGPAEGTRSLFEEALQSAARSRKEGPRERRTRASTRRRGRGAARDEKTLLSAFHPRELRTDDWQRMLAYVYLASAQDSMLADAAARLEGWHGAYRGRSAAGTPIARGAEIDIVPSLPGCVVNPTRSRVAWWEDWHVGEFRVRASPDVEGYAPGRAVNGSIGFYLGPVLIGEAPVSFEFADPDAPDLHFVPAESHAHTYSSIFVSYSHSDSALVERLERAYSALGLHYLRDVHALRSGERWSPRLLELIDSADVFQLCWSTAASTSAEVTKEWRRALEQGREGFIRPVFWEQPMPSPPPELGHLHFAFLELDPSS